VFNELTTTATLLWEYFCCGA